MLNNIGYVKYPLEPNIVYHGCAIYSIEELGGEWKVLSCQLSVIVQVSFTRRQVFLYQFQEFIFRSRMHFY